MKQSILLVLLLPLVLNAAESPWHGARWIACDRPLEVPDPAPAARMGDWITGPAGASVRCYRTTLELPETPVVRAMAWWGTQPSGPASVVANDDVTYFDRLVPRPKRTLDLAFQLQPGSNTVELRFRKPVPARPATFGLRIRFADGTERALRSSSDWKARTLRKGNMHRTFPVPGEENRDTHKSEGTCSLMLTISDHRSGCSGSSRADRRLKQAVT